MTDVIYLAVILVSFAILVGVVRFCARHILGSEGDLSKASDPAFAEEGGRSTSSDRFPR